MKKIYVEGLGLVEGHFSGIGQYILGILRGLDQILDEEKLAGHQTPEIFVIIPFNMQHKFDACNFKHIKAKRLPITFKWMARLWHRGLMPPLDLFFGRGFYLFTRFVTMPVLFNKSGVVIYDLSFELYKQYSDEKNAQFLSAGTRKSLKQVDKIFTISRSAKSEIVDFYKLSPDTVSVATPAADQRYFYRRSPEEIKKVTEKYGIKQNYILALSNLEPRKNLSSLVDAYCMLSEAQRKNTSLLLVGVSGWKIDTLFTKIIDLVNQGYDIIRPSEYVTDQDRAAIISGASILVYPSHYEGFGMPPLEAMACGVPVITANNSSLPEVVGSNGVMVHSEDIPKLHKTIAAYLEDIDAVTSKSIVEGPKQASMFRWSKSARVYWDYFMEQSK